MFNALRVASVPYVWKIQQESWFPATRLFQAELMAVLPTFLFFRHDERRHQLDDARLTQLVRGSITELTSR
jgi:hypothetical protein